MAIDITFNVDNKFNNCPEFITRIIASVKITEETETAKATIYHTGVHKADDGRYYIRQKLYYFYIPVNTTNIYLDGYLEELISEVNNYIAKITQDIHNQDFTSLYSENYRDGDHKVENCHSFDKLFNYGRDYTPPSDPKSVAYDTYEEAQKVAGDKIAKARQFPYFTVNNVQ